MKKFVKENWFKLLIVFLLIIITSVYCFNVFQDLKIQQNNLLLKDNNKINGSNLTINKPKKYSVSIIQIGGLGSRFNQITTYSAMDENDSTRGVYYLLPAEDFASVSFNNPADIMTVSCRDEYSLIDCNSNSDNKFWNEDDVGNCRIEIENKLQNKMQIKCAVKEEVKK